MWIREQERIRIRPFLTELRKQSQLLKSCLQVDTSGSTVVEVTVAAMERALHIGCECITDIGNIIIDACIMRDPSSYQDILTVLADEGVFEETLIGNLMPVIVYRKYLVHEYIQIEKERIRQLAEVSVQSFIDAASQLEQYIEHSS